MTQFVEKVMQFASLHPMLSIAWVVLLVLVIYFTIRPFIYKVKEISPSQSINLINKNQAVVVDIRLHDAFKSGHIVGAKNILPVDIKNGSFGSLERHKKDPVIVVCANGTASLEPARNLVKSGFEQVFIIKDGVAGWNGANLPLVRN